jgi:predicted RNase H-like HicB family nuclease
MSGPATLGYRFLVTKDQETGSVVAEIPVLQIADFGADVPEALDRLKAMVEFHLECLLEEGKPIPTGEDPE